MSLLSKVNMCLIMIAMVFALAPAATYAAAYIKFDGISAKKMPRMRVTDKTTVHEVAVFAARHAGVNVGCISLSWRGQEFWDVDGQVYDSWMGRRTLGSYNMPGEVTFQTKFVFEPGKGYLKNRMNCVKGEGERIAGEIPLP